MSCDEGSVCIGNCEEDGKGCSQVCQSGADCTFNCLSGACSMVCKAGATCTMNCGGTGACDITCEEGAKCTADCAGMNCVCTGVKC